MKEKAAIWPYIFWDDFSFIVNNENTKFPEQEECWYQGVTLRSI